ncbi:MAG: hypothetical protein HUU10_06675 [Bacteroidetes bacterium]|nr:hypothetical protein [Bacteroidota bacterium]
MLIRPEDLPGQQTVLEAIGRAGASNRIPHSLLLTGPDDGLLQALALRIAKQILCFAENGQPCGTCLACQKNDHLTHPDLHFVFPTTGSTNNEDIRNWIQALATDPIIRCDYPDTADILISSIRDIGRITSRSTFESNRQVIILFGADRLRKEAANAFLKTLEEPPDGTFFILLAPATTDLLPTILSRCQRLSMTPLTAADRLTFLLSRSVDPSAARVLASQEGRSLESLLAAAASPVSDADSRLDPFLQAMVTGNLPALYKEFQDWESGGKDQVLLMLAALLRFLQDALRSRSGVPVNEWNRPDLAGQRQAMMLAWSVLNLDLATSDVELARYRLERNVNSGLTLLSLAIRFRKQFRESRSKAKGVKA